MTKDTIIMYSIPAYGHVNSNLYLMSRLADKGFRVLYYSTDPFQSAIENNGCQYRRYPLDPGKIDFNDGRKLLKLYRLILEYTKNMLPALMDEAAREAPCAVIFDSLALWGRAVGELKGVFSFSFYSIAAIGRAGSKSFLAYAAGFSADFLQYAGALPGALYCRRYLKKRYRLSRLGLLPVLMNKGDQNLMGYSRIFQPGGEAFGPEYFFSGPIAPYRKGAEDGKESDWEAGEGSLDEERICRGGRVIYVSLGTIFNRDEGLMEEVIRQFGNTEYQVVMAWDRKGGERMEIPENFTVLPFVNQFRVMKKASLFISAGGMNSVHEALLRGVPCLLCPQQGEQLLNATQIARLGFGTILKNPRRLRQQAEQTMRLKENWDENVRKELTAVHVEEALELFKMHKAAL